MEATGVYWKPLDYALEDRFETWLLNAQHLKNVPGRKTDVADSAWIAQLVAHGLVRPSFVPLRQIRELRDLTRYRKSMIEERTRAVQRLGKVLQDAGIKPTSVASETLGVSARLMLEALVVGTHDPQVLADLARGGCAPSCPRCARRSTGASAPSTTGDDRPGAGPRRLPRRVGGDPVCAHRAGDRPFLPAGGAADDHPAWRSAALRRSSPRSAWT